MTIETPKPKLRIISMYKNVFFCDGTIEGFFFASWFTLIGISIIMLILVSIILGTEYFGDWFIIPISCIILLILTEFTVRITE